MLVLCMAKPVCQAVSCCCPGKALLSLPTLRTARGAGSAFACTLYSLAEQGILAYQHSHAQAHGGGTRRYFEDYLPGPKRTVFHTMKGLSWRNPWGVLRYSANNAFLALVHSQQVFEQV